MFQRRQNLTGHRINRILVRRRRQLGRVSLFFVAHPVILSTEPVAAEGALELAVAGVDDVVAFQILARRKSLGALAALELLFTGVTLDVGRRDAAAAGRDAVAGTGNVGGLVGLPVLHKT